MTTKPKPTTILLATCLVWWCGCGASPDPAANIAAQRNRTNIQKIANAYILCSALNQNRGPSSKEELIDFVSHKPSIDRNLKLMGIDRSGFEDCFVSAVDSEEFTVRWGLRINPDGGAVPLVFEQTGNDNVRRVALSGGRILEVGDDKKYQNLLKGKIGKEDTGGQNNEQGVPANE